MPVPRRNVVGLRSGFLKVLKALPDDRIRVRCKCGRVKTILQSSLKRTKSCGCMKGKLISIGKTQHGHKKENARSPEYVRWINAKERCYNKRNPDFASYGRKGVRVSPEWREDFSQFLNDLGPLPSPRHTLSRLLDTGDYKKGNAVWGSPTHQKRQARLKRELLKKQNEEKKAA